MNKLFAVFGDIHSNLGALNAVLEDCRREGVTDYLCTGDVVGYNANPQECLNIVRELGCPVVKGNHDHYVSSSQNLADFHPMAAAVVEWTRQQLGEVDMQWLRDLPFSMVRMGITIVHATMDSPETFGYVFKTEEADTNFSWQKTPVCFHGHTHCPIIYEKQMSGTYIIQPDELSGETFKMSMGRKYFINVGSVGQPRDGDPRASYVLYDPTKREIRFRRIEYDVAETQSRIRAANLPDRLAQRLEIGQ